MKKFLKLILVMTILIASVLSLEAFAGINDVVTYSLAADGEKYVSKNFQVKEFACNDGSDTILIDGELVTILQSIRDHFGKPVIINGAYRTKEYNDTLKDAAKDSPHMNGMAADIRILDVSPAEIAKYAETIGVRCVGKYDNRVHVDTRSSKYYYDFVGYEKKINSHGGDFNSQPYGAATSMPQPSAYDNFATIKKGDYYIKNGDYYISTADPLTASTSSKLEFAITKDRDFYKVLSTSTTGKNILNVSATNSSDGSRVILWSDTTNSSQRWYFEECNGGYLIHPADNVSLSLTRDTATNKLYVKTTTKASNQIWTLENANHTHSYSTEYELSHPHRQYKICDCGDMYYTGSTKTVNGCDDCHEHSYSTKYELSHPHKQYKICDCGDSYYTGSTKTVSSCTTCNPSEEECRHSVQSMHYETKHPHKEYGICDECGEKEYTGETKTVDSCTQCYPEEEEEIIYSYTLYYDGNGGIEPPSPTSTTANGKVKITNEKMNRVGYTFLGWARVKRATEPEYTGGETIYLDKDTTLYAVWEEAESSVRLVLTIDSTKAFYNGTAIYNDVAPIIENGRTMLPARFIAENFGASVSWNEASRKVTVKDDSTTIEITIGSSTAYVNGVAKQLDSPAFISGSRTYTPVRFICEALGATVEWDAKTRQVIITG